jgi:uncharacterized protein YqjF (DUF2071 family)
MSLPENSNRSFPPPHLPWSFRQTWRDILFAHYRVPAAALQLSLPRHMKLDTFDDCGWLSIVAFRVTDSAPRLIPAIPWVSRFSEVNLRTYVIVDGKPAIYFFSLDASQPLVVRLARASVGLAYYHAEIDVSRSDESIFIQSVRRDDRGPPAAFAATYHPIEGRVRPTFGTLASWLTDRYCSFSVRRNVMLREEIHHRPWILQPVRLEIHENSLLDGIGLEVPEQPDLVHFARVQHAYLWLPSIVSTQRLERHDQTLAAGA